MRSRIFQVDPPLMTYTDLFQSLILRTYSAGKAEPPTIFEPELSSNSMLVRFLCPPIRKVPVPLALLTEIDMSLMRPCTAVSWN